MKKKIIVTIIIALSLLIGATTFVIAANADDDPALVINGANVAFEESVHLIYSVGYDNVTSPASIRLLIWREAEGIHVDNLVKGTEQYVLGQMAVAPENLPDDSVAFKFSEVAAAEMTENLYVRAYYVEDGKEVYSAPKKYSVLQYALNKLGVTGTPTESELLADMLEAMLIYGTTAQKYFNLNTDRLADDDYVKVRLEGTYFGDGTSSALVKLGDTLTLKAQTDSELPCMIWTDENGNILAGGSDCATVADKNMTVTVSYSNTHTYSSDWSFNENTHWHEALCGHDVRSDESEHFIGADGACVSNCGYKLELTHDHTYFSAWSYDENEHWNSASCEHRELTANNAPHDYASGDICTICGYARTVFIDLADVEQGGWAYGVKSDNPKRIRVNRLIPVKEGTVIRYNLGGLEMHLDLADGEGLSTGDRSGWIKGTGEFVLSRDAYLGITIAASGRTANIVPSDFVSEITVIPGTGEIEMNYDTVNVYKFGGEGNDWCFVYFPDNYDPDRAEPYPLVIANHGNGWVMNGSLQKANYTNIGQYMSAKEIAEQPESLRSRFIETEDSSLWYSNPTIEALLAAGYVVAGAQNYGDTLYGNDNCANACVDFFNHLVETYNVEDSCYMIGASNGAMTTLNAVAKLGDKVKSIILQYPLATLISHYEAGKHQDGIEAAYGLDTSKTYTREELEALISEFDPTYKNVVNGVKQGYFPSVKIYYSTTDTTTPATANALPLIAMLEKSGIEYESVQVDSDGKNKPHGHIDHFDPDGFVEWFDNH